MSLQSTKRFFDTTPPEIGEKIVSFVCGEPLEPKREVFLPTPICDGKGNLTVGHTGFDRFDRHRSFIHRMKCSGAHSNEDTFQCTFVTSDTLVRTAATTACGFWFRDMVLGLHALVGPQRTMELLQGEAAAIRHVRSMSGVAEGLWAGMSAPFSRAIDVAAKSAAAYEHDAHGRGQFAYTDRALNYGMRRFWKELTLMFLLMQVPVVEAVEQDYKAQASAVICWFFLITLIIAINHEVYTGQISVLLKAYTSLFFSFFSGWVDFVRRVYAVFPTFSIEGIASFFNSSVCYCNYILECALMPLAWVTEVYVALGNYVVEQVILRSNGKFLWEDRDKIGVLFSASVVFMLVVVNYACWFAFRIVKFVNATTSSLLLWYKKRLFWKKPVMAAKAQAKAVKFLSLLGDLPSVKTSGLEMSVGSSTFFMPKLVPGLIAIFVEAIDRNGNIKVLHAGMGFRIGDCFVTANHVDDHVQKKTGDAYLVPFKVVASGADLDFDNKRPLSDFGPNIFDEELAMYYDIAAFQAKKGYFCQFKVPSVVCSKPRYGQTVTTYGVNKSVALMAASGVIVKAPSERIGCVQYNASTNRGWSGGLVLCGRRAVAMHTHTNTEFNVGLDMTVVTYLINKQLNIKIPRKQVESSALDYDFYWDVAEEVLRDHKGRIVEFEMDDYGNRYFRNKHDGSTESFAPDYFEEYTEDEGFMDPSEEREMLEEMSPSELRKYLDNSRVTKGNRRRFEHGNGRWSKRLNAGRASTIVKENGWSVDFQDEQTPLAELLPTVEMKTEPVRFELPAQSELMEVSLERSQPVRTPVCKLVDQKTTSLLDLDEAVALGYVEGKYLYPPYSSQKSAQHAIINSEEEGCKLYHESAARCQKPTDDQRAVVMRIARKQLEMLQFVVNKEPLSQGNIEAILYSTKVDENKSPGFPFIDEGLTTNAQVLSLPNIVERIQANNFRIWPVNKFIKHDAQKAAKIDNGTPRTISGVSLFSQIEAEALLGALNSKMVEHHRVTPILVGWSPNQPKQGEWFFKKHTKKNTKIVGGDIKNYEWSILEWNIVDASKTIADLAVQGLDMSTDEFRERKELIRRVVVEQFLMPFRLPDGTVVLRLRPGVMTSGSKLTILLNSIILMMIDSHVKLAMGYSPGEILTKFTLSIGGDDDVQNVPKDFDEEKYVSGWNLFGFTVHDIQSCESADGMEFFSWKFTSDHGLISWTPTRFAKHVESLKHTKIEDAAQALVSHMWNHAHSYANFEFFRKAFLRGVENFPDAFSEEHLPSRNGILDHFQGYEMHAELDLTLAVNDLN